MHNPLSLKLEKLCGLAPVEREGLNFGQPTFVSARADILSDGEVVSHAKLLLSGIACHYKLMGDGRRAITAILVPGDFTNHQMPERQQLDFSVGALTSCKLVDVPLAAWRQPGSPNVALPDALYLCMMTDISIHRAWLANIGQRPADKRMAHLFCELRHRLALVGLVDGDSFRLPLIQQDLADALGLSVVHVNRVLQHIRALGLIRTQDRTILIGDLARLEAYAEFDASYLHLESRLLPAMPAELPN
jgi:CRP-like cAMP-binding protein